jgi:putative addiction module CopG family antidote
MRTTQQMSITLPNDMADAVKVRVRIGDYTSESEVIREGLRALMARERALETWLHQQVGPAFDALQADPSRGLSADAVRSHLANHSNKTRQLVEHRVSLGCTTRKNPT